MVLPTRQKANTNTGNVGNIHYNFTASHRPPQLQLDQLLSPNSPQHTNPIQEASMPLLRWSDPCSTSSTAWSCVVVRLVGLSLDETQ